MQGTILLFLMILVNSCAINENLPSLNQVDRAYRLSQLQNLNHWQLEGKIGYRESKKGGSAWISWHQQGNNFEINLSGPFGTRSTTIKGNQDTIKLKDKKYQLFTANESSVYVKKTYQLDFPIEHLRFWIKGLPSLSADEIIYNYNNDGTLNRLEQSGWALEFLDYQNIEEFRLPNKIKGQKDVYKFTLKIKKWLIN